MVERGDDRDAPFGRCTTILDGWNRRKGEVIPVSFAEDPTCGFDGCEISGRSTIAEKLRRTSAITKPARLITRDNAL
jgi:hypothetical protein